jgi:hypothetical protein
MIGCDVYASFSSKYDLALGKPTNVFATFSF